MGTKSGTAVVTLREEGGVDQGVGSDRSGSGSIKVELTGVADGLDGKRKKSIKKDSSLRSSLGIQVEIPNRESDV